MSKIDNEILKTEEQLAGFNPGEPDDDTFSLKDEQNYPGELPDFSDIQADDIKETFTEISELSEEPPDVIEEDIPENEISDEIENDEVESEVISAEEGESLWDSFDGEEGDVNESEIDAAEESLDITAEPEVAEPAEVEGIPTIEEIGKEEAVSEDIVPEETVPDETEEIPDNPIDNIEVEKSVPEENPTSLEVDDDLKSLISNELEKGKQRNSNKEKNAKEEIKSSKDDFVPVSDNDKDAKNIDLNVLNDDSETQEKVKSIKEQNKNKYDKKVSETKIKEKEKNRFGLILLTAAATFLITLALGFGYLNYFTDFFNKNEIAIADSTNVLDNNNAIIDSNQVSENTKEEIQEENAINEDDEKKENTESENREIAENTKNEKKEIKAEPVINKKPKQQETTAKSQQQKISKPKRDKVKSEIATSETKKTEDIAERTPINTVTDNTSDEDKVFIVQIYATPSKKDAEDWLRKLNDKNIENAFISTKKVRGETLYRVRFGNFSNKEEARTVALKHGFAQTWIDRVK